MGPVNPGNDVARQLMQAAESLVSHTGLKGVFGVDFVLRQGAAWFIEVNPRLTASHMLYENPTSHNLEERSLVTRHLAAFGWRPTGWHYPSDVSELALKAPTRSVSRPA